MYNPGASRMDQEQLYEVQDGAPKRPEILEVLPENIPEELKKIDRWVCWKLVISEKKDGTKKWTKPPMNTEGFKVSITDPANWDTFDNVMQAYDTGRFDGIGFALSYNDDLMGVDLDHCIKDGKVQPEAQEIIDRLKSYTEISPSGEGIRIFGYGNLPEHGRKKDSKRGIEVYDDERYLTVTGNTIGDYDNPQNFKKEISKFYEEVFGDQKVEKIKKADLPKFRFELEEKELFELIGKSKQADKFNRLDMGDDSGYGSTSEADLAYMSILAFWTQKDPNRMDKIYRESARYREKWDSKRGRLTYGELTINKAISGTTEVYRPNAGIEFVEITDSGKPYLQHSVLADHIAQNYPVYYVEELATHKGIALYFEDEGRYLIQGEDNRVSRNIDQLAVSLLGKYNFLWKRSTKSDFWEYFDQALRTVSIYDFDQHPRLILYKNGVYNAETGVFSEKFDPELLLTKRMDCNFDLEAAKPENMSNFTRFFEDVARDNRDEENNAEPDKDLMNYMRFACGYAATGDRGREEFYFAFGNGQNGKSKLLEIIAAVMGSYAAVINVNTFTKEKGSKAQDQGYALAGLRAIRFLSTSETKKKTVLDSERIKNWTSGRKIKVREIYQSWIDLYPQLKIFIDGNNEVEIDSGIHTDRRFVLLPFNFQVSDEKKDLKLYEKLLEERDSIGTWLGLAAHDYCTKPFPTCAAVIEAKEDYYEVIDKLKGFVKYVVRFTKDSKDIVTNGEFWESYKRFSEIIENRYPLGEQTAKAEFKEQLARHGIHQSKNIDREYKGIRLKEFNNVDQIYEIELDLRNKDESKQESLPQDDSALCEYDDYVPDEDVINEELKAWG